MINIVFFFYLSDMLSTGKTMCNRVTRLKFCLKVTRPGPYKICFIKNKNITMGYNSISEAKCFHSSQKY